MQLHISRTGEGVSSYPMHRHDHWEIMLYLSGSGSMRTAQGPIPFQPGSIIIMPPGVMHGSVSEQPFMNISIGGPFASFFPFEHAVHLTDNDIHEGQRLASLLMDSRSRDACYLEYLAGAYIAFLRQSIEGSTPISRAVDQIIAEIRERYADSELRLKHLLEKSGYAEDYIRQQFTRLVGTHPTAYLMQVRIERARLLIDIYGAARPLSEIAEACGYTDYVSFSKAFRRHMGMSAREYLKSVLSRRIP